MHQLQFELQLFLHTYNLVLTFFSNLTQQIQMLPNCREPMVFFMSGSTF